MEDSELPYPQQKKKIEKRKHIHICFIWLKDFAQDKAYL